jgi:hypothetical protein
MKAQWNKPTEEEIDAVVTALADDDNAWDQPVVVHKNKPTKSTPDIRQLLAQTRGCLKPLRDIDKIDKDAEKMRSEWE